METMKKGENNDNIPKKIKGEKSGQKKKDMFWRNEEW